MKLFFCNVFFFFSLLCFAQNATISGYISEKGSGEKQIGAAVYDSLSGNVLYANNDGFYSLSFVKGQTIFLKAEQLGFLSQSLPLVLQRDTSISFALVSAEIDTVIITDSQTGVGKTQMSVVEIPIAQIKQIPALLGETDVLKVFQLMPGIKGGAEGSAGIYVRGGSPDQNLILLDDIPLYYVTHLGGFVSLFDANALGSVKLYKGGFPARYAGRLSSVIDLRIKEGNQQIWKKSWGLGVLSAHFCVEGPIKKDKTTLLVSSRLSTFGPISYLLSQLATEGNLAGYYSFYDFYTKLSHKISEKDKVSISVYYGKDNLRFTQRTKTTFQDSTVAISNSNGGVAWGNTLFSAKWTHLYNSKLFHHLTAAYTNFNYNLYANARETQELNGNKSVNRFRFDFNSGIKDITLKLDYDYFPHNHHQIKFGTAVITHFFSPGISLFVAQNDTLKVPIKNGNPIIPALETNFYVEDEIQILPRLNANLGVNFTSYFVKNKIYPSLQPRFSTCYNVNDRFSLKGSYTFMQQYLHLLSHSTIGFPSDLWVPATKIVPPQKAHQWAIGSVYAFKKHQLELTTELYYKQLSGLITYREGSNILVSQDWQQTVETGGKGWVYGLEMMLQKKTGKTTGWIGYGLSYNHRKFQDYNQGKIYPYTYDRRHDISVVVSHHFSKHFSLNGTWVYTSGRPATLSQALFGAINTDNYGNLLFNTGQYYGAKNSFRLPAYHRMDISFIFRKERKKGYQETSIGFYNVYNKQNPFLYYYQKNPQTKEVQLYQYTIFPILPFLNYNRSF